MQVTREEALDHCLGALMSGVPVEEALRPYPALVDELRPLLELAQDLKALPEPTPTLRGLMRAVAHAAVKDNATAHRRTGVWFPFFSPSTLLRATAIFVALAAVGWGTATAASDAIPGDFLYPIKRITERVHFFLSMNDRQQAELRLVFSERRLSEAVLQQERGKAIDEGLLREMLDEAKRALDASVNLPERDRSYLVSRAEALTAHQRRQIVQIRTRAGPDVQKVVDPYYEMCGRRMEWMCDMMADMGMPVASTESQTSDSTGGVNGSERMSRTNDSPASDENSPRRIQKWMDMCPMWKE